MEILNLIASACVATSSETPDSVATPLDTLDEKSAETDGLYYSDSECNSGS